MAFAERTKVPVAQTKTDIERRLQKYGAKKFVSGWSEDQAVIGFEMHGRSVRVRLPLPDRKKAEFRYDEHYEREHRRRWRAMLLCIKAKLEAVESGIVTFENEWLAHFVMPGGLTVGELVSAQIADAYATGRAPTLLIGFEDKK